MNLKQETFKMAALNAIFGEKKFEIKKEQTSSMFKSGSNLYDT